MFMSSCIFKDFFFLNCNINIKFKDIITQDIRMVFFLNQVRHTKKAFIGDTKLLYLLALKKYVVN